jgi:hypothetical protein
MEKITCMQVQNTETNEAPAAIIQPLTDEALAFVGLQKVTAFVRAEPSSNAKRKQRSREKSEQQGLKQLNIQLPVQLHQVIKDIAQELQQAGDVTTALQNMLSKAGQSVVHTREPIRGWRAVLARLLGLV